MYFWTLYQNLQQQVSSENDCFVAATSAAVKPVDESTE